MSDEKGGPTCGKSGEDARPAKLPHTGSESGLAVSSLDHLFPTYLTKGSHPRHTPPVFSGTFGDCSHTGVLIFKSQEGLAAPEMTSLVTWAQAKSHTLNHTPLHFCPMHGSCHLLISDLLWGSFSVCVHFTPCPFVHTSPRGVTWLQSLPAAG